MNEYTALSEEKKEVVRKAIKIVDESLVRLEGEKNLQKDSIDKAASESGLDKKVIRKMAKVYHKGTFAAENEEHEEFVTLFETVVKGEKE